MSSFVDEFLDPWNRHDLDAILGAMSPTAVWEHSVGSDRWGTAHRGREAIRAAAETVFQAIPDIHYELVRSHEGPGHVIVELRVVGHNRETGQDLDYQACDILELVDREIVAKRSYRKVVSPVK